jgi:hypothetical protein
MARYSLLPSVEESSFFGQLSLASNSLYRGGPDLTLNWYDNWNGDTRLSLRGRARIVR